ncbi:hypothetical protein [Rhodopseudomonas palustris]|uniref:hypothetical protein n=1 Tax=Rhodopseudomonas palustris TaxID=1076 RepID=UPI000641F167|nr:hypothetical protein [Rhodopseudomonas palustris]
MHTTVPARGESVPRILDLMKDGRWRSVVEISKATRVPLACTGPQLRKIDGIEKVRVGVSFNYRLAAA